VTLSPNNIERPLQNPFSLVPMSFLTHLSARSLNPKDSAQGPQTVQDLPTDVEAFTAPGWVPQKAHNGRSKRLCKALIEMAPQSNCEPCALRGYQVLDYLIPDVWKRFILLCNIKYPVSLLVETPRPMAMKSLHQSGKRETFNHISRGSLPRLAAIVWRLRS
jgi:hypothetical protein